MGIVLQETAASWNILPGPIQDGNSIGNSLYSWDILWEFGVIHDVPSIGWGSLQEPLDLGVEQCDNDAWRFPIYNRPGLTHVLEMLGSLLQSNLIIRIHWRIWTIEFKASHAFDKKRAAKKAKSLEPNHLGNLCWAPAWSRVVMGSLM